MGRYRGSVCRLCRREGEKLFLKGTHCDTDKCGFERRPNPPGQLGRRMKRQPSGYAIHLREKQKAKRIYGIPEHQFRRYFKLAERKKGITGELLLQFLERRFDNVVYKLGFTRTRASARQLISHGHFLVNDRKVDIPSYLINPSDKITLREKSQKLVIITETMKSEREVPVWLSFDRANFKAEMLELPKRENIPVDIREELIVELYSK